jgi:hypothetical protein
MIAWRINGSRDKDSFGVMILDPTANATTHTSFSVEVSLSASFGMRRTIAMGPNPILMQYVFNPDDRRLKAHSIPVQRTELEQQLTLAHSASPAFDPWWRRISCCS